MQAARGRDGLIYMVFAEQRLLAMCAQHAVFPFTLFRQNRTYFKEISAILLIFGDSSRRCRSNLFSMSYFAKNVLRASGRIFRFMQTYAKPSHSCSRIFSNTLICEKCTNKNTVFLIDFIQKSFIIKSGNTFEKVIIV